MGATVCQQVLLEGVLMRAALALKVFSPLASAFAIASALALGAGTAAAAGPSPLLEHISQLRTSTGTQWCSPLDPSDQPIRAPSVMRASSATTTPQDLFSAVASAFDKRGIQVKASLVIAPGAFANAYIRGGDEVVITAPLASSVQDKSELAFVFAHELSHMALGHAEGGSVRDEIAADELALSIIESLGLNPCAGAEILDRLSSPLSASLVSVSPRLDALHQSTPDGCG